MAPHDDSADTPAWSNLLGENGRKTFTALVRQYFDERKMVVQFDEDTGVVKTEGDSFAFRGTFGLQNLAQICRQADRDEWHDIIARHFDAILAAQNDLSLSSQSGAEFMAVKSLLRARLFPADVAKHADELVYRRGPAGTIEVLSLDQPRAVRTVSRSEMQEWGREASELLDLGRRNLLSAGTLKAEKVEVEAGAPVYVFSGDTYYAASHALVLDEYLPDDLAHGALIGIPRRDVLIAHYIRNLGTLEVIGTMLQLILALHREGPGSITQNLYWYRRGEFVNLEYELEGDTLNFSPPQDFVELLNSLSDSAKLS